MRHQNSYSRCQALYFMPWAEQMCKQHLGLKMIQRQKAIWTEETSNKCLLCDHRWPLGHVVLKIVKRQKTIPVMSTHTLIIWFVLAQSILQIQSNLWFTCAQFLAGGLWWFGKFLMFMLWNLKCNFKLLPGSSAWGSIKFYSQYTDWGPDISQPRLRRLRLVLDLPAGVVPVKS